METTKKKLIRIPEAAKVYGCSRQNMYRLVSEKKLKSYKRYGVTLVDKMEVERLKDEIKPHGNPRGEQRKWDINKKT